MFKFQSTAGLKTTTLVVLVILGCSFRSLAQNLGQTTRILFLFDASQSMYARWESDTKFEVAKKMLSEMVDSLQGVENLELALRVYGHTKRYPPQDCDDTRLEVPFGKQNGPRIKSKLNDIKPSGTTPIARALEECGNDFPAAKGRHIIILITDGIEECNGDPCAVSALLQRRNVVLKPFVIGLGLGKDFIRSFDCVGNYFDATDETQFRTAFNIVITQALNNTTMQVNLIDFNGKPSESNVGMTFYDQHTGEIRYNFIHTMTARGVPDTLPVDPLGRYRLTVHTLPPVSRDSITLVPGKHNVIAVDAPQGDLQLKVEGSNEYRKLKAIVRKRGEKTTLNVQDFDETIRYIVGDYDLEILTTPRTYIDNVSIDQSKTTTVQIPTPGMVTFICNAPGVGEILLEEKNILRRVHRMGIISTKESLLLQPGSYRLVFRPKNSQSSIYTIEKTFRVAPGTGISVNIN
ncbi:MAG: VWA domain-containing protein [Sphingobacteriales bacterium]|jgi:Ca-activated chloride channel family protein|nr:VWA domain-containing protein [Sphingobacteriales bacterium]